MKKLKNKQKQWDDIHDLNGEFIINVTIDNLPDSDNYVEFQLQSGIICRLQHRQDCCESVYLDDICGDINDLRGLVVSARCTYNDRVDTVDGDKEWTFYTVRTNNGGDCTFRFIGESNGYYSTSVDFFMVTEYED